MASIRMRVMDIAAFLCLFGTFSQTAAESWMHTRGRGQVKLPSPANRYLKSSHSHASGTGLSHNDLHRSRYSVAWPYLQLTPACTPLSTQYENIVGMLSIDV